MDQSVDLKCFYFDWTLIVILSEKRLDLNRRTVILPPKNNVPAVVFQKAPTQWHNAAEVRGHPVSAFSTTMMWQLLLLCLEKQMNDKKKSITARVKGFFVFCFFGWCKKSRKAVKRFCMMEISNVRQVARTYWEYWTYAASGHVGCTIITGFWPVNTVHVKIKVVITTRRPIFSVLCIWLENVSRRLLQVTRCDKLLLLHQYNKKL